MLDNRVLEIHKHKIKTCTVTVEPLYRTLLFVPNVYLTNPELRTPHYLRRTMMSVMDIFHCITMWD